MRQALVKVHDTEAGILTETDEHRYRFVYHAGYSGAPVSLTMPITEGVFEYDTFPPFFDAFLPEGQGLESMLQRYNIAPDDYFTQLLVTGQNNVGAVTVFEV